MKERWIIASLITFNALSSSFAPASESQESAGVTTGGGIAVPDLEKAGLHGPVRSVTEEGSYPPVNLGDGRVDPELKFWKKTEYDREGRIAALWGRDSSREHGLGAALYVTHYTYNSAGQLLRVAREKDEEPEGETIYLYNDHGRLESITNSANPDNPIAFRYDANGRKSKIAIAKPIDSRAGQGEHAVSYSPDYFFETNSGAAASMPGGGSALTLYDDHDRPTEVQTRNASGQIVFRSFRVYDDNGHVLEEKQTMDDVLRMIPATDQKKIMDQAGVSAQELRDQIAQVLGGSEMQSTTYTYDAQGRKTLTIQRGMGHMEERIETSYNEHGDVAKETWQTTMSGTKDGENDGSRSSERIYFYEYDSYGNWTVRKTSSRSLPDGTFKNAEDEMRRTIEYF